MKKKLVLIFGNSRDFYHRSYVKQGYLVGLLFDVTSTRPRPDESEFEIIRDMNLKEDLNTAITAYRELASDYDVVAVLNLYEEFVFSYTDFCKAVNLPAPSEQAALNSRDKSVMKALFREHIGEHASSAFARLSDEQELLDFANQHGYPLVLKPISFSGSKFVTFNHNEQELLESFRTASVEIQKYESLLGKESLVFQVEAFMPGTNHSVDCVINKEGQVIPTPPVDVLTGTDIGHEDFHHFARVCPSSLSDEHAAKMKQMAVDGCKALGLTSCIAHVELIYTPQGPQIIEIAARPGANRAELLFDAYELDLAELLLKNFLGEVDGEPQVEVKQHMGIVTPYPQNIGVLNEVNESFVQGLASVYNFKINAELGQKVGPAARGFFAPSIMHMKHQSEAQLRADIDAVINCADFYQMTAV